MAKKKTGSVLRSRNREIRKVRVSDLEDAPFNFRRHSESQSAALNGVIDEIGFFGYPDVFVMADGRLQLCDGHLRKSLIIKKYGADAEIEVNVTDFTEAEAKKATLTKDPIAAMAETDSAMLRALMDESRIEDESVLRMLGELEQEWMPESPDESPEPGEIVEDEVPEPPVDPITKPGDLWILGRHRLLCGDSTNAKDVARLMDGAKAELCFTSPPYNLGKSVGLRNGARKGKSSAYNETADTGGGWADLMRAFLSLALDWSECVVCNVQLLSGNKFDLLALLGEYATKTIDIAIWVKSNPQPAMADGVMTSAFEFVWMLCSEDKPNRRIKTASFARGTFSNVFESPTASGHDASIHGAVFPVKVAAHYIDGLSDGDSVIYEPFCGSGTTLIAADQLGRTCYGMELSPNYVDVIVKRWENLTGEKAVCVPASKSA